MLPGSSGPENTTGASSLHPRNGRLCEIVILALTLSAGQRDTAVDCTDSGVERLNRRLVEISQPFVFLDSVCAGNPTWTGKRYPDLS